MSEMLNDEPRDHGSREKTALVHIAKKIQELESSLGRPLGKREIWEAKLEVCREYSLTRVPKNSEVLDLLNPELRKSFQERLRRKRIRTASGIAVVTAITKPFDCPHGTCTFCPGGVRFGTPQSYTKDSPAVSFGASRGYDPKRQVSDMLLLLEKNGHDTSKVELILLGGTILAMPRDYQLWFVKKSYEALNGENDDSTEYSPESLSRTMTRNELTERHRCVGLTIETKPDWCKPEHIDMLLSYGTTRVEIGVQSLNETVLKLVNRGHTLKDTIDAFRVAKDSGLKVVAHMMPGLPGSNPDRDLSDLLSLFEDKRYRPDMLKVYPALVVEGTALYKQYEMHRYAPYDTETLKEILCRFKSRVPPWVRIMRIQREIPKAEIAAGNASGNLRQIVLDEMKKRGLACRCIRCREVGHKLDDYAFQESSKTPQKSEDLVLKRMDYAASAGIEVFLFFEEQSSDTLHGFLRLRIPSGAEHRSEIRGGNASLVRELHVYGTVVPLGETNLLTTKSQSQHRGLGTRLLAEAERISRDEFGKKKIVVISAVGTREYYRKRRYLLDGAYMSKDLV
jgi:elongator complex protein 3